MPPLSTTLKSSADVSRFQALGIELTEIETFLAVAELGSFSLAAQHLHVTQPSVTGRVQRLETALGAKLLVRTTRKTEMTAQGQRLFAEATLALKGLRQIVAGFRENMRLARQRVVVAATPTIAALTLPAVIRDHSKRFTDVQIVLRDLQYPDVLAAIEAGGADLGVLAYEGKDSRFRAQPLSTQDVVLVVPRNHPLAQFKSVPIAKIAGYALIVVEQYAPMLQGLTDALKQRGMALAPSTIVSNLNTLLGMLDADMGPTLLPRSMARLDRQTGHVTVEIEDLKLVRRFFIVTSAKRELGTAAESFVRFLKGAKR